jgi:hypothetical protein
MIKEIFYTEAFMKQIFALILLSLSIQVTAQEMSCDYESLKIEKNDFGNTYRAIISNQAFIATLKAKLRSKVEAKCSDCAEETILISPTLPQNTRFMKIDNAEVVVVDPLTFTAGYKRTPDIFKTSESQTSLATRDSGIDLLVENFETPRGHETRTYFLQHWWFANCKDY